MNRATRDRGFTLIELLVVISVIAVLVSLIIPSLDKARDRARDLKCMSTMRQALVAVSRYNNDYKSGLMNYSNNCDKYNTGWQGGASTGHGAESTVVSSQDLNGVHISSEARSGIAFWRGKLIAGSYMGSFGVGASSQSSTGFYATDTIGLGCPAKDYRNSPTWWGAYNGNPSDWYESYTAATMKQYPAYVWYGPGIGCPFDVAEYSGGHLNYANPSGAMNEDNNGFWTVFTNGDPYNGWGRFPLLTCPDVNILYNGVVKTYENPHRPRWGTRSFGGNVADQLPYAENVGYSDGSVRWFESTARGLFNPF